MILSILIATLESRRTSFETLYTKLRDQVLAFGLHGRVEILSNRDAGRKTIGLKRNELVAAAEGDYVCFIDDDDDCSPDYVARLASACMVGRDCVGIIGKVWWHAKWVPFVHSLRYRKYDRLKDGTFVRPPNHLNPIRRGIVAAHGFTGKDYGEDSDFAMGVVGSRALKTEEMLTGTAVYYYTPAADRKG